MLLPWQMLLPCFVCYFFCWGRCFYLNIEYVSCIYKYRQMLKPWLMLLPMFLWQMFQSIEADVLPLLYMLGWCYCLLLFYVEGVIPHNLLQCFELADVIAKCLMELPLQDGTWLMLLPSGWWNCHYRVVAGRCYGWQADVIALVNFYNFGSEMLSRTSSQICGRWYLPMFPFRDGSLTLIYRASLMVLIRFCSSLPTISKFSILMLWPVVL